MDLKGLIIGASMLTAAISATACLNSADSEQMKSDKNKVAAFTTIPDFEPSITVAGETIDLNRYDMRERYDRELTSFTYTHNLTTLVIKRANRYFPIIEPILKEEGIPTDFIYLAAIESTLNPRAVSPAKAAGLWQIMEGTGRQYGLEVNSEVDERYHVEKSTRAAAKYLKEAYAKYGSWMAVAASYNAGQGRISGEMRNQDTDSVFDLWLVEETSRYPFRIMALKEIMSDPYKYGFVIKDYQLYKPIRTKDVVVNYAIPDLAAFAKNYGITYSQLKDFNSWLRGRSLPNKTGRTYVIKVPEVEDLYYSSSKKPEVYDKKWIVE